MPVRIDQGSPPHWALRGLGRARSSAYVALVADLPRPQAERVRRAHRHRHARAGRAVAEPAHRLHRPDLHRALGVLRASAPTPPRSSSNDHGWSPGWTFPVAAVICFAVGVLVGIPALRLKGLYLALVTLALAQIFPALVRKFDDLTGGSAGIDGLSYDAPAWTGLDPGRRGSSRVAVLARPWARWPSATSLVRNLVKSRIGRAMVAVRDNPTAAAVMGVNVAVMKTIVFGLSAALAGMAGCTFALRQTQATPENLNFTILGSIIFLVIMVVGGTASLLGPIVGAFVYYRVDEFTRGAARQDLAARVRSQTSSQGRPNLATLVFSVLLIL